MARGAFGQWSVGEGLHNFESGAAVFAGVLIRWHGKLLWVSEMRRSVVESTAIVEVARMGKNTRMAAKPRKTPRSNRKKTVAADGSARVSGRPVGVTTSVPQQLHLEKMVTGGEALARPESESVVFVEGGLPGEEVIARVQSLSGSHRRGHVTEVVTASPDRIDAPCRAFHRGCGGCQWQNSRIEAQHGYKVDIVRDCLARLAKRPDVPVSFAGAVSPFGYRTTIHAAIDPDGRVGLHERRGSELVRAESCLIAHPQLREIIDDGRFSGATNVTMRVGIAGGERVVWTHGADIAAQVPDDVTVSVNGKKVWVTEVVGGRSFRVSARSFFQSGPEAAELLVRTLRQLMPKSTGVLLDAYSGVGVLASTLSDDTTHVVTIESDGTAVNDAKVNLADRNARIVLGEVAAVRLGDVPQPDVIVADPARSGLGKSAARALAQLGAPLLLLVSCDPASFARDVTLLSDLGLDLEQSLVLDMFSQTHHMEVIGVFRAR